MRLKPSFLLLFLLSFTSGSWGASEVSVIGPETLKAILSEVTVVDARDADFDKGHIPGSIPMSWSDWAVEKAGAKSIILGNSANWGKVLADSTVETRLQGLGFSQDRQIVVVGEPGQWGEEGRIAWNFLFWGAKKVSLLEGGYSSWKAKGLPLETGAAKKHKPGNFKVKFQLVRRARLNDVEENLKLRVRPVFDARTQEEFQGKTVMGQARGGRIPGSTFVPAKDLYQANGKYITATALKKMIASSKSGQPITYCTGGVRSALLALLIEARLGVVTASYDGSIWEWSSHKELPMVSEP